MDTLQWLWNLLLLVATVCALRYDPAQIEHNMNTNQTANGDVLNYWGEWQNHTFTPSPSNWRIPFYTILLDRFANGDPTNDNANGTQFEHDMTQTQLRHGGDMRGLQDSLDYLQGMGIKALYMAGSPYINVPWAADSYSPLDFTLLDYHFGTISEWQAAIADIHQRGMYIIIDCTMTTMGDLIGFEGYLNTSTPFNKKEHNALWKGSRRYNDFSFGNDELPYCDYPRFYSDDGVEVLNLTNELVGCRDSEFDQYGEVAAFGEYPEWQRQISKFAFVQDRLREWRPDVLAKLERLACLTLASLDIDGFRIDKGLTITIDAQSHWSNSIRTCAKRFGKQNFFISGEVVGGNAFGSVYIGRGRTPENYVDNVTEAVMLTDSSDPKYFARDKGLQAFDGVAFHYTVYRFLTRFLGMSGAFGAKGDPPHVGWTDFWETILLTNDMVNANDGVTFDPRHMYGVTNQDVFRWPTIKNGTQRQLLGYYVVALILPGIPTLVWGEEQAFYVLDSNNANYVFGRSPMSSAQAWGMHGCYQTAIGNSKYYDWPIESGLHGCKDPWINLDHRDPSHPVRNFIKNTHEMRENYPVFQDGFSLRLLSNQTYQEVLPGSSAPTEIGIWSIERAGNVAIQENFAQIAWLVYTNENRTMNSNFDCMNETNALMAPFSAGSTVKNIYFPYDEYRLQKSNVKMGELLRGCLPQLQLPAWGFKAFVLKDGYIEPSPVITKFSPGHDYRMLSTQSAPFELHFSAPMDCQQIAKDLQIKSTSPNNQTARLDMESVRCSHISNSPDTMSSYSGTVNTTWAFKATLINVNDGIHQISVNNISTAANRSVTTNSHDHFLLRVGQSDNPMVFPGSANYSSSMLFRDHADKKLYVLHKAPGADKFRYSLNFGTTYSDWEDYPIGINATSPLAPKVWSGTKLQDWKGEHVIVEYWSHLVGSSDHVQHADLDHGPFQRQFPNVFLEGTFNQYGFDKGFANQMWMNANNTWSFDFVHEWPAYVSLNLWGINPDGQPDKTRIYGDIDGDSILDRIPPASLIDNVVNITDPPPSPFLGWQITFNDADYRYQLIPIGSRWNQLILYMLLWLVPPLTGAAAVWAFVKSFYGVKLNELGITTKKGFEVGDLTRHFKRRKVQDLPKTSNRPKPSFFRPSGFSVSHKPKDPSQFAQTARRPSTFAESNQFVQTARRPSTFVESNQFVQTARRPSTFGESNQFVQTARRASTMIPSPMVKRLTVLIATMEYDVEDWGIKVKIGGLGVMSSLMGKNLKHQDLIWVIPCIGGIDYPVDSPAESIAIKILGSMYEIKTQYHVVENITYVLLDAPVFRQQTKADPYPPRMDDLESAVYYSAWNSCIAEVMRRFPIDLYHINDYHGAVAPLHLLPKIVPCLLSLHNAEFQGLWPMRSKPESQEVCEIYNLSPGVVQKYVRFGEVFNLLHAASSYLRIHQNGFGAVGVSTKYGKRALARYPIFWGMKDIGGLPNPDPTDTGTWSGEHVKPEDVTVDEDLEASKPGLKQQAQTWANLVEDPEAELFVFVGRWSNQKGVDAIADVFPSILDKNPHVQLICVGPVIDLFGKFAAMKLARMMEIYKGRVFSKPEFTALPPYIFSGADFALMPSRDEPFGLVAVEFGRKGVLCVGARVGGLGNMPGWWFTIESTTARHFIQQFRTAIENALRAKPDVRALMRARATKQRFPVSQWVEDLEKLQSSAIGISHTQAAKDKNPTLDTPSTPGIMETQSMMSALQSKFSKPVPRPRPVRPVRPSRPSRPTAAPTPNQTGGLSSIAEGNQLVEPGPGLGSKMGPSNRRKQPPPPLQRSNTDEVPNVTFPAIAEETNVEPKENNRRPSMVRVPSTPDLRPESKQGEREATQTLKRLSISRVPSMPQLRPNDEKAVQMVGVQVPTNRKNNGTTSVYSPSASRRFSTQESLPESLPESPTTPHSARSAFRTPQSASSAFYTSSSSAPSSAELPTAPTTAPPSRPVSAIQSKKVVSIAELPTIPKTAPSPKPVSTNESKRRMSSADLLKSPTTPPSSRLVSTAQSRRRFSLADLLTSPTTAMSVKPGSTAKSNSDGAPPNATTKFKTLHAPNAVNKFSSWGRQLFPHGSLAVLSTSDVREEKPDSMLEKVQPFFSDPEKVYESEFNQKLKKLNGKNSEKQLCIEEYLLKSEKSWFGKLRDAELGKPPEDRNPEQSPTSVTLETKKQARDDGFGLGDDYKPPSGVKRIMLIKIGDWPVYSFLLAFGQIIAANSYQITLLNGTIGESANKLYVIASIYLFTSFCWWILYRKIQTVYVVSIPFIFYGLAFLLIALSPLASGTNWVRNVATGCYALASSSGALYFAVNFADEGGAPVTAFVYRACVIQGTQQLYVVALWYWGAALAKAQGTTSVVANLNSHLKIIVPLCVVIACLMWSVGLILFFGLPKYYHQAPGHIPSFYVSLFRRKILIWFFIVVVIQNYWLSAPYGRNWLYLWSNQVVPAWQIVILILVFFVGVWILFLYIFNHMSKSHSWVLPVFAMGLGAPRWAQILWSTSNTGHYLPWAAGPVASALAGRSLWLWLGVLDAIQGVGFGMILLQTLTRFHVLFTLIAAQMLGSLATIAARASAPDKIGPGTVFPELCVNPKEGLNHAWFWVALLFQLAVPIGFVAFFRKEQLSKA